MEIFILSISAFFVSILTFFSGFGLGTILTPILAALLGSWILLHTANLEPFAQYQMN